MYVFDQLRERNAFVKSVLAFEELKHAKYCLVGLIQKGSTEEPEPFRRASLPSFSIEKGTIIQSSVGLSQWHAAIISFQ